VRQNQNVRTGFRLCRIFLLPLLKKAFRAATPVDMFVFGKEGHAAEPRTMQRNFQRSMRTLGLVNVHFHTLRHSFAIRLLELGVDIQTISALLGHQSVKRPWNSMDIVCLIARYLPYSSSLLRRKPSKAVRKIGKCG